MCGYYPVSLSFDQDAYTILVGAQATLPLTREGGTGEETVTWKSSNTKIATVSADGVVTAVKTGTATITVTVGVDSASVDVNVVVPTVTLDQTGTVTLELGETLQLNATVTPESETPYEILWSSSNASASVVDGLVTALDEGIATITASTAGGQSASVKVQCVDPTKAVSVALDKTEAQTLALGDTLKLTATVLPETAESVLTWTSSNTSVATVDADGVVTPVQEGTAAIIVTTDNLKTASVTVTVFDPTKATAISLVQTGTVELDMSETLALTAVMEPVTATSALTWTTSSAKIATVDADGVVTPVKEGTATITVKTSTGKSASVKVTVTDRSKATSVAIDQVGPLTLNFGDDPLELSATMQPETATSALTWSSSNAKVATVDEMGTVYPVKEGTVTITVKTSTGKSASVKVTVVDPNKATAVAIDQTGAQSLNYGEELVLSATMTPADATSYLTWSSSNTKVAIVDPDGIVYPVKEGTATITVKTSTGKSASVKVTVVDHSKATAVALDKTGTVTLDVSETLSLVATMTPVDATSTLTWSSSSTKVATVDGDGNVYPVKEGTATITVKTSTGKSASVKVTVVDQSKATSVAIDQAAQTLSLGATLTLTASMQPETATSALTWSTSSAKVATVDANGVVTPVKTGTATITVKTETGKKATVKVTVVDPTPATAVALDLSGTQTLDLGKTLPLTATVTPADATRTLTWSTSSAKIATVDANGVVTPVKEGTATITVATSNGKKATVKVTVVDPTKATAVTLDQTGTVTLALTGKLALKATMQPATATSALTWSSSSAKVATVDANGVVTPVKTGTATITVKTATGKSASVKVTVVDPVPATSVTLDQTGTVTMNVGDAMKLHATMGPEDATSLLTWTSSAAKYVTVDALGYVTAVKAGTATITVTTTSGKKATVKIKVVQ